MIDLFAGLRGWSKPFEERGHETLTLDFDKKFDVDLHMDILKATPRDFPGVWDAILASPPCESFSVAAMGKNWTQGAKREILGPKTAKAVLAMHIVQRTLALIEEIQKRQPEHPIYYVIENPVGALRVMPFMRSVPRFINPTRPTGPSVTYCAYGDKAMKPTDLWGSMPPNFQLRPACKNGMPCHEAAPRGAKTGTQGKPNSAERAVIPRELALDVCKAIESAGPKKLAGLARYL